MLNNFNFDFKHDTAYYTGSPSTSSPASAWEESQRTSGKKREDTSHLDCNAKSDQDFRACFSNSTVLNLDPLRSHLKSAPKPTAVVAPMVRLFATSPQYFTLNFSDERWGFQLKLFKLVVLIKRQ